MDRGARWAPVHGVAKSQTQFSDSTSTEMFNNVVLVSGVQQSDSAIHILVSILLQNLFPLRLSQNIEHHSLCYAVDCCLFYIVLCVYVNPKLLIYPSPLFPLVTVSLFSMSVGLFLFCR